MSRAYRQYEANVAAGDQYLGNNDLPRQPPASLPFKAIAYYLPQFHSIPENDAWWGTGFTEWTNVTKALPRYDGHLQPRLPADLGFYDLANVDVLRAQAELVRRGGLYGLCIHDYWFNGRKVLDNPLNMLLANRDIDLRFCLNWANENWTRRWNGLDGEVLLEQRYDPNDLVGYARSILPMVRDPRYIRVDGRPLIMVYRPKLFPAAREMFKAWRAFFLSEGQGDPYLVMASTFDDADPRPYGLDAAAGFPPHNTGMTKKNDLHRLRLLDKAYRGHARSYAALMEASLRHDPAEYRFLPGVCPGWDNEARKPGWGSSFYNATPAAFERWLHRAAVQASAAPPAERIVFINAWNEWAEGAVLEPDRHFGYANLVAVRRVVERFAEADPAEPKSDPARPLTRPSAVNVTRNLPLILDRIKRRLAARR